MTLDYNAYLTNEQKAAINTERLTQLAAEAYQNEVAMKAADNAGDTTSADVFANNIDVIVSVMETHQAELDSLA
jgi:hypothetical protein